MAKIRVRILNGDEPLNGVSWWRMYQPISYLQRKYGEQLDIIWHSQLKPVDLMDGDAVYLVYRPCNPEQLAIMEMVKNSGAAIIADYDDDLLHIPTGHPSWQKFADKGDLIRQAYNMANKVWVSTEGLKDSINKQVLHAQPNTVLCPNAIHTDQLPSDIRLHSTAMWRGDISAVEDLWRFEPTYSRVYHRVQKIIWFGYMPTWQHPKHAVFHPWLPVLRYFDYIKTQPITYFWKPLSEKIPFNHCKSNVSALEAAMAGGICVSSFSSQQWNEVSILPEDIGREEFVRKKIIQAQEVIRQKYNLDTVTEIRLRSILEAHANR